MAAMTDMGAFDTTASGFHAAMSASHSTSHDAGTGDHHSAKDGFTHENDEYTVMMIGLRKYRADIMRFNAARPKFKGGRRVPEADDVWAGHNRVLVTSLGASQLNLGD